MRWIFLGLALVEFVSASCTTETTCGCLCDEGGIIAHCSSSVAGDGGPTGSDGGTE